MATSAPTIPVSAAPKRARKPRPKIGHFTTAELEAQWTTLLNMKDPGFKWDASGHNLPKAIEAYHKPLHGLLSLCPSGFPSHADLREALVELDRRYSLFDCIPSACAKTANKSAEDWRRMCKQVYAYKKDGVLYPELTPLINLITLPTYAIETPPLDATAVASMFPEADDEGDIEVLDSDDVASSEDLDDVHMVAVLCKCPKCAGLIVPETEIGGQRKATVAKRIRHRLKGKTPPLASPAIHTSMKKSIGGARGADQVIKLPVSLVQRRKASKCKGPEMYILDATKAYVAGQTAKASSDYIDRVTRLSKLIESGKITRTFQARLWVRTDSK